MFDWAVAGVNFSLPGEGGAECAAFLPLPIKIYESVVVLAIAICVFIWARSCPSLSKILFSERTGSGNNERLGSNNHVLVDKVEQPLRRDIQETKQTTSIPTNKVEEDECIIDSKYVYKFSHSSESNPIFESLLERNKKNWLLVLLCLIWGAEIGFKFASRTVIYLLNPCHVVTASQIYLLAAEPSHQVTVIFRIHLYFLNGAILAFLFPNTESRLLPCETSLYWIQHTMMLVVPIYLLCQKGVFNVEPLRDLSWGVFSFAINIVYHFAFLQPIALVSQVNLNQLLCPAQLDPFRGNYYRIAGVIHQSILCPIVAKACVISAHFLSSTLAKDEPKDQTSCQVSNIICCDKNSYDSSEKTSLIEKSDLKSQSCNDKEADCTPKVNREIGNLANEVTSLERNEQNIVNPVQLANTPEEQVPASLLRQRKRKYDT